MKEYDSAMGACPHCGYVKGTPVKELYHLIPGTVLMNKYIVGKVVGFGGFGVTYIGWDKVLEKVVAIKEYLPSELATRMEGATQVTSYDGEKTEQYGAGLERFIDEALRLAKLNTLPGIVHIFDSFAENNTAYIIMEYLKGDTLKSILKQRGTLSYKEAVDIAIPVLESLDEVHKKGIIHRDIAPDNIIITDDGRVKLIDFGAARYATTAHSKSLSVVLKPGYAPEEQYRSHGKQGPWSDIYAMGATLYRMITGHIPEEALERKTNDKLQDISKFVPEIPKACENAIMNALNVNAEDRIQSAKEFADALSGVSEVERNKVKNRRADQGRWSVKMKIIAASIVAVCVVIIGAVVVNNTVIKNVSSNSESISLYGKTVEEAEKALNAKNMSLKIDDSLYDDGSLLDELDENSIVSPKDVSSGTKDVEVIVYAGKKSSTKADINNMVKVPNLYGMKKSKAISTLKEYGLDYEIKTKTNDKFVGNVFVQSTKSGSKVKVGSTVTITVGKASKKETTPATEAQTQAVTTAQSYVSQSAVSSVSKSSSSKSSSVSETEADEYNVAWLLGDE
jgi:serine/threonine protein kinase